MIINGKIINEIEINDSFKGLCEGPKQLLTCILEHIIFESDIETNVIIKDSIPNGIEKRSLWVKNSWPYGIGMLIDGEYRMDYGMSGYPVNIPFLHSTISPIPEGLRQLSDGDLADYGIANTTTTAYNRLFWYLFEPPSLT